MTEGNRYSRAHRVEWDKRVRRLVPAHPAKPGPNSHPDGAPFAYCRCHFAIVKLAGVWWHLAPVVR